MSPLSNCRAARRCRNAGAAGCAGVGSGCLSALPSSWVACFGPSACRKPSSPRSGRVHTYYTVRAELELDGKTHVLEATGRCDWHWRVPLPMIHDPNGWMTYHGGFLTKVLDDGRAIVIFPGKHCSSPLDKTNSRVPSDHWRWSRIFNQPGTFFSEFDLVTGEVRDPEGTRRSDVLLGFDLYPAVLVLDDARAPKAIRYYPNPKEHMASDCASLRIKSYRVTNRSSGAITRRELEVPYLANLTKGQEWVGFLGRVIPFSTFDPVPWVREVFERQVPFTPWRDVIVTRDSPWDWRFPRDWDRMEANSSNPADRWILRDKSTGREVRWRELDFRRPPGRDVAWDHAGGVVSYPPSFVGSCHTVVTLYPALPKITIEAAGAPIGRDAPLRDFLILPSEQALASIERETISFNPWEFEEQP